MRWMSWSYGLDTTKILHAKTMEEQRAIFERDWARVFRSWFVRWAANRPTVYYMLGIPPQQFGELATAAGSDRDRRRPTDRPTSRRLPGLPRS